MASARRSCRSPADAIVGQVGVDRLRVGWISRVTDCLENGSRWRPRVSVGRLSPRHQLVERVGGIAVLRLLIGAATEVQLGIAGDVEPVDSLTGDPAKSVRHRLLNGRIGSHMVPR